MKEEISINLNFYFIQLSSSNSFLFFIHHINALELKISSLPIPTLQLFVKHNMKKKKFNTKDTSSKPIETILKRFYASSEWSESFKLYPMATFKDFM